MKDKLKYFWKKAVAGISFVVKCKTARRVFKKFIKISVVCAVIAGILTLAVNLYVKNSVKDYILTVDQFEELQDIDCILVLGCGVWNDTPSHLLADRLEKGIALQKLGVCDKLLMSGDHGRVDYNEVSVMKQYAVSSNVDSADIFMDHAGFSTYESMYRAKEVFGAKKIVIVTQEYHMSRAVYIAQSLGMEAYGVPAEYRYYSAQRYWDAREALARVKDFFYCMIKPLPTYLGEEIDLCGDGNVTNDQNDNFYYE